MVGDGGLPPPGDCDWCLPSNEHDHLQCTLTNSTHLNKQWRQSITRELRQDYLSEETANIVNSSSDSDQEKISRSKSIEFSKSNITPVIVHI